MSPSTFSLHNHLSRGVTYSSSCQGKQDCRTRDGICLWEAQHLGSSPGGRSSRGTCQPLKAPSRKDEEDLVAESLVQNHQLLTPFWQQELVFAVWPSLPLPIQVFFSQFFFVKAGRVSSQCSLLPTTFAAIPPFIGKEGVLFFSMVGGAEVPFFKLQPPQGC